MCVLRCTMQVINGLLLPFVVICLLLTINDPYSMPMLPSVPSTIASTLH